MKNFRSCTVLLSLGMTAVRIHHGWRWFGLTGPAFLEFQTLDSITPGSLVLCSLALGGNNQHVMLCFYLKEQGGEKGVDDSRG